VGKLEVRVFPSLEELSWAAATRFEDLARIKAIDKKIFSAALSGGSTPKRLFRILASTTLAGRIRWQSIHLFQVDERCVPPDDPESNYRMIRETLLESVQLPEGNFHRLAADQPDVDQASRQYAQEIARTVQAEPGKPPRLDLIFLGMGPDGHTASLFPGTQALEEQVLWVRPNYVEKLKMHRLTMTFPVLNAAAQVIFLVSGADKAEVLFQVLEGPPGRYPAQRIQPADGRVSWFVDEDAAHLLSGTTKG
jgi:6-phosphogluconolactonase